MKKGTEAPQARAVFGSGPERVDPEPTPRPSPTKPETRQGVDQPQDRGRKQEEVAVAAAQPRSVAEEPQRSAVAQERSAGRVVGDHGEAGRIIKDPAGSVSAGSVSPGNVPAAKEAAAERFLHYEPPGSRVADPGELADAGAATQSAASTKPIREFIRRWADTLLAGDLERHMSFYAPTLVRFNGSSDATRETVRAAKQRQMSRLAGVRQFELYEVQFFRSREGSVVAEFRIESDAADSRFDGWHRLELRQLGGLWKVSGEEKLQRVSRRR